MQKLQKDPEKEIRIETIRPDFAPDLAELQRVCFPTLGESELMIEAHFLNHCKIFPEGNFVALAKDKNSEENREAETVVGLGAGFFIDFNFDHTDHTFLEIIADGYYSNHDPNGEYYYGSDISVHPDYRGHGIGRKLYDARKGVVRAYNKKGIVAGGVLPGYPRHRDRLSIHDYVEQVVAGELSDPTLSFQLRNGFVVRGFLENYIVDSASDNWATLIYWENSEYSPPSRGTN